MSSEVTNPFDSATLAPFAFRSLPISASSAKTSAGIRAQSARAPKRTLFRCMNMVYIAPRQRNERGGELPSLPISVGPKTARWNQFDGRGGRRALPPLLSRKTEGNHFRHRLPGSMALDLLHLSIWSTTDAKRNATSPMDSHSEKGPGHDFHSNRDGNPGRRR